MYHFKAEVLRLQWLDSNTRSCYSTSTGKDQTSSSENKHGGCSNSISNGSKSRRSSIKSSSCGSINSSSGCCGSGVVSGHRTKASGTRPMW